MRGIRPLAFVFGVLVWLVWLLGLLVFFSPSSCCVSFPFIDDLGTPPTRRPYSWKKTQHDDGEKNTSKPQKVTKTNQNKNPNCELMLIAEDTRSPLSDPIHEELWENKGFNWSSIKASGKCALKSRFAETIMKTTPRLSGSLPMNQAFSLLKLSLPLPDSGTCKSKWAVTP